MVVPYLLHDGHQQCKMDHIDYDGVHHCVNSTRHAALFFPGLLNLWPRLLIEPVLIYTGQGSVRATAPLWFVTERVSRDGWTLIPRRLFPQQENSPGPNIKIFWSPL